ncbi:winged helix-turn-helix domain-containing protein [Actinomadura sp. 6N118]|uniref:winged helix-turn-helix domain-containing protein n=1 Tax=Actinomadura sp. 6N118 TaxID=3375151 RepID=UPI0037BB435D
MTRKAKNPQQDVVADVQSQSGQAEALAQIAGQHRLSDPRTNPATRRHADKLRDEQQRRALDAEHARMLRRHRVTDQRAADAERALEAVQAAREAASPARSVLALHTGSRWYGRLSLAASLVLAAGSAMGVEDTAQALNAPVGSGWIAEVGLTGLATAAISYRAHLARHRGPLESGSWQSKTLWALMTVPLLVSVACNLGTLNLIGAACAIGATAFALLSCVVADRSAAAMQARAAEVTDTDAADLHATAMGDDLFTPVPVLADPEPHEDDEDQDDEDQWPTAAQHTAQDPDAPETSTDNGPEASQETADREIAAFVEAVKNAAREAVVEVLSPRPAQRDDTTGNTAEADDDAEEIAAEVAAEVTEGLEQLAAFLDRPDDDPPSGPDPDRPPAADDGGQGAALVPSAEQGIPGRASSAPQGHIEDHIETEQHPGRSAEEPAPEGSARVAAAAQARRDAGAWRRYEVAVVLNRLPHTTNGALAQTLGVSVPTIKRHRRVLREAGWDQMTHQERQALMAELRTQAERASRGQAGGAA